MNKLHYAELLLSSLTVYRGILDNPAVSRFYLLLKSRNSSSKFFEQWGNFLNSLCSEYNGNIALCFKDAILKDDNVFTRMASHDDADIPENILAAVNYDLMVIKEIINLSSSDIINNTGLPSASKELANNLPFWISENEKDFPFNKAEDLVSYHKNKGFGIFSEYKAFIWRNGNIKPVEHTDSISLKDLTGYEYQRNKVLENTKAFLNSFAANNCLLYGDKGTGKSSTVKAILNEFSDKGLRMIEMPKESLCDFPLLVDMIAYVPLKFIIFIDDLSFTEGDDRYSSLKALLEGGLAAKPDNAIIYATSNRRHIIKEKFSDRDGDEIHRRDTIQESLSLFDRFGLSVNFSVPGKEEYLKIVHHIAQGRNINISQKDLDTKAEMWALERGGRSPRCAKQFISYLEALTLNGKISS